LYLRHQSFADSVLIATSNGWSIPNIFDRSLLLTGTKILRKFIELAIARASYCYILRSIEFVIRVGAGTEAVGFFESIHLFVNKLMLQNAISEVEQRARLWLEQNG
jgi:hypothetical protein